jgi:hypothetical protein
MRTFFKLFFLLLLLLPFALIGAVYLGVQQEPAVTRNVELSPGEVQRARDLFAEHDPRKLRDGEVNTVVVSQRDLDLALNYLINLVGQGSATVSMNDGAASVLATLRLPKNKVGHYINVEAEVLQGAGIPKISHMRIGKLPVPGPFANFALRQVLDEWYGASGDGSASDLLREVKFAPDYLQVTYEWDSRITDAVRGTLLSADDQRRLEIYNHHLVDIAGSGSGSVSLATLMQHLFGVAAERSQDGGAAAENRAVILLLSAYVNDRGMQRLAPEAASWPQPDRRRVTLGGRRDFAQHFITSAALSAMGGSAISDAIGLFKEVDDSRGGSGFSFNDLCADLAGTKFGEWATSSTRAGRVQSGLAAPLDESVFMADVSGLPEHMDEAEFARRFGGVGAPKYNEMATEIERRVETLPLYR